MSLRVFVPYLGRYWSGTFEVAGVDAQMHRLDVVVRLHAALLASVPATVLAAFAPQTLGVSWNAPHRHGFITLADGPGCEPAPMWPLIGLPLLTLVRSHAIEICKIRAGGNGSSSMELGLARTYSEAGESVAQAARDACDARLAVGGVRIDYPGAGPTSWTRPYAEAIPLLESGWNPGDIL